MERNQSKGSRLRKVVVAAIVPGCLAAIAITILATLRNIAPDTNSL